MAGLAVTVQARGLAEFRKAVKRIDREFGKDLRRAWLKAAKLLESRAVAASPPHARASIKGRATQRAAFIRVAPRRGDELAVFLGQKQRSGWYSNPRYRGSAGRQHRPWVGTNWDPGEGGNAPYFIGDAVNEAVDEVVDLVADEIVAIAERAMGGT